MPLHHESPLQADASGLLAAPAKASPGWAWPRFTRLAAVAASAAWVVALSGCAALPSGALDPTAAAVVGEDFIVVAVADTPEVRSSAGAAVRGGYGRSAGYAAAGQALAAASALATNHSLTELKAWTIQALGWRCMLYRLPEGAVRQAVLATLAADPRVRLAQPLNTFETLSEPPSTPLAASLQTPQSPSGEASRASPRYNDPYWPMQVGFAAIDAAGAQRQTRGEGITVAVIDTQVDAGHPDLQGRISMARDFVGRDPTGERHGTEVAGIIAAVANNGLGIAGVAPAARLLALRSCWAEGAGRPARCNSFTLAQGLAAAIAVGADVINLSLGGPADPLLEALAGQAMARGAVLVAALPVSGRREGFPSAVPGVLTVAVSEAGAAPTGVLAAPGRQVLTLAMGGGYDFASGSSMASAHVSGAVALLRSRDKRLESARLAALLAGENLEGNRVGQPIDACLALARINPISPAQPPQDAACAARPAVPPPPRPSAAGWPAQEPAQR